MKDGLDKDPDVQSAARAHAREPRRQRASSARSRRASSITDAELKKVYDANKKDYEQVKARHILIAFKGSPAAQAGKTELTEDEAKAKAEDIRKQIAAGAEVRGPGEEGVG